jgi:hypothetical protein
MTAMTGMTITMTDLVAKLVKGLISGCKTTFAPL